MKPVVRLVITGPVHKDGRTPFDAEWTDPEGRPKGQVFLADIEEQKAGWIARGYEVVVVPLTR